MQLVFITKLIKPEKCAENVYLAYVKKENLLKIWFDHCFYSLNTQSWYFFKGNIYGDKVNNTCRTSTTKQSLNAGEVLRKWYNIFFSNSLQNCSEIVLVDEIMGNKMKVMTGQRMSRSGKTGRKRHCLPLYRNEHCFLFNERQFQNEASLHNPNSSASLFTVTSCGKREPAGDKVYNICVTVQFKWPCIERTNFWHRLIYKGHNNRHLNCLHTITVNWHASKYKVEKLQQDCCCVPSLCWTSFRCD